VVTRRKAAAAKEREAGLARTKEFSGFKAQRASSAQALISGGVSAQQLTARSLFGQEAVDLVTVFRDSSRSQEEQNDAFQEYLSVLGDMRGEGMLTEKDIAVLSSRERLPKEVASFMSAPLMALAEKERQSATGLAGISEGGQARYQKFLGSGGLTDVDVERKAFANVAQVSGLETGGVDFDLSRLYKIAAGESDSQMLSPTDAARMIDGVQTEYKRLVSIAAEEGQGFQDATRRMQEASDRAQGLVGAAQMRQAEEGTDILGMTADDWASIDTNMGRLESGTATLQANMGGAAQDASGIFSVFNEDNKTRIGGFFTGLWGGIGGFFGSLETKVDDLFGHSISSDVEADFTKSSATITEFLSQLEQGLKETVQKAMVEGFHDSFGSVDEATALFAERQVQTYEELGASVTDIFGRMWLQVLDFTLTAGMAVEEEVAASTQRLSSLSSAVRRAESLSEQLSAAEGITATPVVPESALGEGTMEDLITATHAPLWYTKHHRPAVAKLNSQIAELVALVKRGQGRAAPTRGAASPVPGGARPARRAREDLAERLGIGGFSNDY